MDNPGILLLLDSRYAGLEKKKKILQYKKGHSATPPEIEADSVSSRLGTNESGRDESFGGKPVGEDHDLLSSVIDSIAAPFAVIDISTLEIIVANKAWQQDQTLGSLLERHKEELAMVVLQADRGVIKPVRTDKVKGSLSYSIDWSKAKALEKDQTLLSVTIRGKLSDKAAGSVVLSSEQQYKSILEHTPAIIFVIDQAGTFLLSEGKGLAALGLEPGQVVGANAFEMYADNPEAIDGIRDSLAGNLSQSAVEVGKNSFETFYSPLKDDDGQVTAMIGMSIDITERRQAEVALVASEEKYRLMFESMVSGLAYHKIVLDDAGKPIDYIFLEVNDSFEEQTGLSRDDIIGKRITEILPGIEKAEFDWIGAYGKVALDGVPARFEQFAEPLDRWYDVSAFQISKGYFVASFFDVTERVRTANDLRNATEKLKEERAELAGKNIALKEVLSHLEAEKNSIKERITENVRDHVLPLIDRIKGSEKEQQSKQIEMLKKDLLAVASPFMHQVKERFKELSPRELEICQMVKTGYSSKEIAELLAVSVLTVHKHREMIRKKLGIKNSDVKLGAFLESAGDFDSD